MANKKRRDQVKRQRPNEAPPPVLDLDFTEDEEAEQPERPKIELFKYKGETYFMAEPDATLMLELIEAAGQRGEMGAVYVMLQGLMGDDAYRTLKSIPNLKKDELKQVINRVMHYSMDVMDEVMGES